MTNSLHSLHSPLERAKKIIKKHFSIAEERPIGHFPDLTGDIHRMVINHQGKKTVVFVTQTNNDIIVRLFDSSRPEKYFTEKKWAKDSALRSNRPYIFNWKALYDAPDEKQWVDMQLPMHNLSEEALAVVFKMFEACKEIAGTLKK